MQAGVLARRGLIPDFTCNPVFAARGFSADHAPGGLDNVRRFTGTLLVIHSEVFQVKEIVRLQFGEGEFAFHVRHQLVLNGPVETIGVKFAAGHTYDVEHIGVRRGHVFGEEAGCGLAGSPSSLIHIDQGHLPPVEADLGMAPWRHGPGGKVAGAFGIAQRFHP